MNMTVPYISLISWVHLVQWYTRTGLKYDVYIVNEMAQTATNVSWLIKLTLTGNSS
jgi:hypothetical protein